MPRTYRMRPPLRSKYYTLSLCTHGEPQAATHATAHTPMSGVGPHLLMAKWQRSSLTLPPAAPYEAR